MAVQPRTIKTYGKQDGTAAGNAFASNFSTVSSAANRLMNDKQTRSIKQEGIDQREAMRELDAMNADTTTEPTTNTDSSLSNVLAQKEEEKKDAAKTEATNQKMDEEGYSIKGVTEQRVDEPTTKEVTQEVIQETAAQQPTQEQVQLVNQEQPVVQKAPQLNAFSQSDVTPLSPVTKAYMDGTLTPEQQQTISSSGQLPKIKAEAAAYRKKQNLTRYYEQQQGMSHQQAVTAANVDIEERKKIQDLYKAENEERRTQTKAANNEKGAFAFAVQEKLKDIKDPAQKQAAYTEMLSTLKDKDIQAQKEQGYASDISTYFPKNYNPGFMYKTMADASEFSKFTQDTAANEQKAAIDETKANRDSVRKIREANLKPEKPTTIEMGGIDYQVTKQKDGTYNVKNMGKHVNKKGKGSGGGASASELNYIMKRAAAQMGLKYNSITETVEGLTDTNIGTFNDIQGRASSYINDGYDAATAYNQAAKDLGLPATQTNDKVKNEESMKKSGKSFKSLTQPGKYWSAKAKKYVTEQEMRDYLQRKQ